MLIILALQFFSQIFHLPSLPYFLVEVNEPRVGFEPTTYTLRMCCSATELPRLERVKRIELSSSAWEADALPLSYTRLWGEKILPPFPKIGCLVTDLFFIFHHYSFINFSPSRLRNNDHFFTCLL